MWEAEGYDVKWVGRGDVTEDVMFEQGLAYEEAWRDGIIWENIIPKTETQNP